MKALSSNGIKFSILVLLFVLATITNLIYAGSELINLNNFEGEFIFSQIRLPKAVCAMLAGSALAVSGLILQIIFRNPLAGPYVLGISSGASLFVSFTILVGNLFFNTSTGTFFNSKYSIIISSISGSLLITLLILYVSKKISSPVILLILGLMFSQICSAIQSSFEYFANPASLKLFVVWGMGSLGNTTLLELPIFIFSILVLLVGTFFFKKALNVFLLGQNYAQNLGIDILKNRFWLILFSSCLTGITTAFCGPIAFVGIAIPIFSRKIFPVSNQQIHLFACILLGAIVLLISDTFCFLFSNQISFPINMITTFVGAPLLIYLLFKNKTW